MTAENSVVVVESDEGALILAPEHVLQTLSWPERSARTLPSGVLAQLATGLGALSQFQAESGRWVKMDAQSAELLKSLADHNPLVAGVIRGPGGRIVKHVKFEQAGLLTPAAPQALAVIVAQQAIQYALEGITDYLKTIDEKLDQLLKHRKVDALGHLGGIQLAIEEAEQIQSATGKVSSVTWSKVQDNGRDLQNIMATGIAELHSIAERVASKSNDVDRLAQTLASTKEDIAFWLGILGRAIAIQDRQYLLELSRVAEVEIDGVDEHREGIGVARQARARRLSAGLAAVARQVSEASTLSNARRLANPFSSTRVTRDANEIIGTITHMAEHVDMVVAAELLESTRWRDAARDLLNDTAVEMSSKVRYVLSKAQEKREQSILEKAERIRERKENVALVDGEPRSAEITHGEQG